MIAIIDYGVGNLFSLKSSLNALGFDNIVTCEAQKIANSSHVILPGVGAFGDAAEKLRARGLDAAVLDAARRGQPLLGICLGMQLLFEESLEFGTHRGLGLLPGKVIPLRDDVGDKTLKIPHMGWNSLENSGAYVYYVHSFYVPRGACTLDWSKYGDAAVSGVVGRENVRGTQFHPEKSGEAGLKMLKNFCEVR
ncbi:imidazole glycerol phosphate synthase subunit HisH [Clostridia bacterium]|nr:imidazole glycerol phosphate synthase subunit HisH [Clostridia bacterium]